MSKNIEKRQDDTAPAHVRVVPLVDILENDDGYVIVADMPGVEPGEVTVNLDHQELLVEGRQTPAEDACVAPLVFARSFRVPEDVSADGIDATLEAGVLRITLGKPEESRPRRIEINAP
jgi:HSP20 family molecular chaperone IbpA